jgi:hypothetical protein
MNLFTALLGGRASTLHGRVVPDSGDLRIRTHSRSWDCGCYRWSVVFDAWPAIFEASRALPQARFRSSASLPLDSTEPPSLHHGIASTTTARIAEERSSSGSSCPTTSQHAGLEEREREGIIPDISSHPRRAPQLQSTKSSAEGQRRHDPRP